MIRINLLPFRSKHDPGKLGAQRDIFIFFLIIGIVSAGLYWYNSKLNNEISALQFEIEHTKKEIVKYNKIAKEVEEIKAKMEILKKKLEVIEELDSTRLIAFQILDVMSDIVTEEESEESDDVKLEKRMWFTSFEAKEEKIKSASAAGRKGKKKEVKAEAEEVKKPDIDIKIKGIALDNKTVADLMTRIENTELFTGVKLITLKQEKFKQEQGKEDINLKGFEIECKKKFLKKSDENTDKEEKK